MANTLFIKASPSSTPLSTPQQPRLYRRWVSVLLLHLLGGMAWRILLWVSGTGTLSLTHSLTYSLTISLTYSPTHSPTHSLTHCAPRRQWWGSMSPPTTTVTLTTTLLWGRRSHSPAGSKDSPVAIGAGRLAIGAGWLAARLMGSGNKMWILTMEGFGHQQLKPNYLKNPSCQLWTTLWICQFFQIFFLLSSLPLLFFLLFSSWA